MRGVVVVVFLAALLFSVPAEACGDKFLLVGRGASYRNRYVAIHPAKIILFGQKAAGNEVEVDVRRILRRAGHRVDFAPDGADLESLMRASGYDFIITPMEVAEKTERRVRSVSPKTMVLPILFAFNEKEALEMEGKYSCIRKSGQKQRSFLAILDDAMTMRQKGDPPRCEWKE
jgi:hypothetical protein